jgi:hypothetical protein
MFSSLRTSPLAQRSLGALDLARSFLLLEDDNGVDWEVDRNEPSAPIHPHRAPLRSGLRPRRPGALPRQRQDCISPTSYGRPAHVRGDADSRMSARAALIGQRCAGRGPHA